MHFDFPVYLQITFKKHSILHPLDREEPLNAYIKNGKGRKKRRGVILKIHHNNIYYNDNVRIYL